MDGNAFDRPGARSVMPIRDARSLGITIALCKSPVPLHHPMIRTGIISSTTRLKEQVMFRTPYALSTRIAIATALVIGTSGVALADDSSMNPFTGDFYRELHGDQNLGNSTLARTIRTPAKDVIAECASPDSQRATRTERFLAVTPTPIFSDKGA
jgi:hypothetical protein